MCVAITAALIISWRRGDERANRARLGFELMFHGNGLTSRRKIHGCDLPPMSATEKHFTGIGKRCQGFGRKYILVAS